MHASRRLIVDGLVLSRQQPGPTTQPVGAPEKAEPSGGQAPPDGGCSVAGRAVGCRPLRWGQTRLYLSDTTFRRGVAEIDSKDHIATGRILAERRIDAVAICMIARSQDISNIALPFAGYSRSVGLTYVAGVSLNLLQIVNSVLPGITEVDSCLTLDVPEPHARLSRLRTRATDGA